MTTSSRPRQTGWVGWVYFAGFAMVITGILNAIVALNAIFSDNLEVSAQGQTVVFDIRLYGWLLLVVALITLFSGFGIFRGHVLARTVGVFAAGAGLIGNFLTIPVFPIWSVVMIVLYFVVIWALIVHGDEVQG